MTKKPARQYFTLTNVAVGFSALRKAFQGKYGANYSVSVILDKETDPQENLEVLGTIMKLLTKGGPVDIKDESGLNSTGKFRLSFNSKQEIPVFDGEGEIIEKDKIPLMGEGTTVNLKFTVVQGDYGVNKYIQGVQIVKLVPYESKGMTGGGNLGFGKVSNFKVDSTKTSDGENEVDFSAVFK